MYTHENTHEKLDQAFGAERIVPEPAPQSLFRRTFRPIPGVAERQAKFVMPDKELASRVLDPGSKTVRTIDTNSHMTVKLSHEIARYPSPKYSYERLHISTGGDGRDLTDRLIVAREDIRKVLGISDDVTYIDTTKIFGIDITANLFYIDPDGSFDRPPGSTLPEETVLSEVNFVLDAVLTHGERFG